MGNFRRNNFRRIKESIQLDTAEDPENFYVLDEGEDFIECEDISSGRLARYEDISGIGSNWIRDKIVLASSVKGVNVRDIADFVFDYIPREIYQTLNKMVFIANDEADFDELFDSLESITGYQLLECHNFPSDNQLGISWVNDCCVVIHVGNIEKCVDEMIEQGEISSHERESEIDIGIKTTVAHELRHLAQDDPYFDRSQVSWNYKDPEADAEQFARDIVDKYLEEGDRMF